MEQLGSNEVVSRKMTSIIVSSFVDDGIELIDGWGLRGLVEINE